MIRPALTFALTDTIPVMIERFRTGRTHMAVILDAEKRLAGIVTFEDVLEEIVGDIRDEFDIGRGPIFDRTERSIVVSGTLTMRELQAETGWPLEWTGPETVAIRWVARRFGDYFGVEPILEGVESETALLNNVARCQKLFGYPSVSLDQMIEWLAGWIGMGGASWNKPTHFEARDGKF